MKTSRRSFLGVAGATLLSSCADQKGVPPTQPASNAEPGLKTAGIRMIQVDGKYRVWTKRVGRGDVKVLLLHGGPGATHFYLECFEDFLPQAGIEFYYYDQLGCGFSDQPNDTSLWTVERFREEVEQVRQALGLEQFVLYGQSWGAMLAIEYALKYQSHLKKMVLSNMSASVKSVEVYMSKLRAALPADVQAQMEKFEKAGQYENPVYEGMVVQHLYTKYLCRLDPWPEPVERAFKNLAKPVYNTLQGPNEFVVTGRFKNWDRWADLGKIQTPTLCIGSKYDEMDPADIEREAKLLPNGKYAFCPNGGHLCMWDDQQAYFDHLVPFLKA